MNKQMTAWVIIVGVFVVAMLFRVIERMREETVRDAHLLELGDEDDAYFRDTEYGDEDECGDL